MADRDMTRKQFVAAVRKPVMVRGYTDGLGGPIICALCARTAPPSFQRSDSWIDSPGPRACADCDTPLPPAPGYTVPQWFRLFVLRQREAEAPCKHGHPGCSDHAGGFCLDELLTEHPEWNED